MVVKKGKVAGELSASLIFENQRLFEQIDGLAQTEMAVLMTKLPEHTSPFP